MKLETHEGTIADHATSADIAPTIASLTDGNEAFVVLSDGDEWYVQAAGSAGAVSEQFIVERRDGCAGEHYRGDRRVTADELVAMLDGCLHGTPSWSHALSWHRVVVDGDAPAA
jgi:hypothetical protein